MPVNVKKNRSVPFLSLFLLLPVIISEIEGSNQLIYKEKYLDNLYALIEKYQ